MRYYPEAYGALRPGMYCTLVGRVGEAAGRVLTLPLGVVEEERTCVLLVEGWRGEARRAEGGKGGWSAVSGFSLGRLLDI